MIDLDAEDEVKPEMARKVRPETEVGISSSEVDASRLNNLKVEMKKNGGEHIRLKPLHLCVVKIQNLLKVRPLREARSAHTSRTINMP